MVGRSLLVALALLVALIGSAQSSSLDATRHRKMAGCGSVTDCASCVAHREWRFSFSSSVFAKKPCQWVVQDDDIRHGACTHPEDVGAESLSGANVPTLTRPQADLNDHEVELADFRLASESTTAAHKQKPAARVITQESSCWETKYSVSGEGVLARLDTRRLSAGHTLAASWAPRYMFISLAPAGFDTTIESVLAGKAALQAVVLSAAAVYELAHKAKSHYHSNSLKETFAKLLAKTAIDGTILELEEEISQADGAELPCAVALKMFKKVEHLQADFAGIATALDELEKLIPTLSRSQQVSLAASALPLDLWYHRIRTVMAEVTATVNSCSQSADCGANEDCQSCNAVPNGACAWCRGAGLNRFEVALNSACMPNTRDSLLACTGADGTRGRWNFMDCRRENCYGFKSCESCLTLGDNCKFCGVSSKDLAYTQRRWSLFMDKSSDEGKLDRLTTRWFNGLAPVLGCQEAEEVCGNDPQNPQHQVCQQAGARFAGWNKIEYEEQRKVPPSEMSRMCSPLEIPKNTRPPVCPAGLAK